MASSRGQFSSRLGFVMASAGAAVGLGNIWGFPTQVANNGGAAFVLVYLVLAFSLAYPVFMAELLIGRYGQANAVTSLQKISRNPFQKHFAFIIGFGGILVASIIFCLYVIIAGWMMSHAFVLVARVVGFTKLANWAVSDSSLRSILFSVMFMSLTIFIIQKGVEDGIEKLSKRLMPLLIILLVILITYVLTLDFASKGLEAYLKPDFSRLFEPNLIISALGQAFFSFSSEGSMPYFTAFSSKGCSNIAGIMMSFVSGAILMTLVSRSPKRNLVISK